MKVLVTGGIGVVGQAAVTEILAGGHTVRLLSRNAAEDANQWPAQIRWIHRRPPRMHKQFAIAISALAITACASRTRAPMVMTEPCAALADTVSKYVSVDALPLAHIVGNPGLPRTPATLGPGDSAYVEFLVRPDGMADTSTVVVSGASDPEFLRSAVAFAAGSQFVPAQSQGCPMMSKYSLVVKSRAATR